MSEIKVTGMGFADQLPAPDPIPAGKLFPRAEEVKKYKEFFFDPRYDGFEPEGGARYKLEFRHLISPVSFFRRHDNR